VLFTDIVGSIELRARLGEQAADELRRRLARQLSLTPGR
jgi:class 3 adenylate cyclase